MKDTYFGWRSCVLSAHSRVQEGGERGCNKNQLITILCNGNLPARSRYPKKKKIHSKVTMSIHACTGELLVRTWNRPALGKPTILFNRPTSGSKFDSKMTQNLSEMASNVYGDYPRTPPCWLTLPPSMVVSSFIQFHTFFFLACGSENPNVWITEFISVSRICFGFLFLIFIKRTDADCHYCQLLPQVLRAVLKLF